MTAACPSADSPSVLIVEPSAEAREVLATALAMRGLRIFEADEPRRALELAREEHPDVIVLDFDQSAVDDDLQSDLTNALRQPQAGLIVLGNDPPKPAAIRSRFVAKPYHYAPLVQTIERMASHARAA